MTFKGIAPNATILTTGLRQKTKKVYDEYGPIPGSNVELYIDENEYIGHDRTVEMLIKDPSDVQDIFDLFDGSGKLVIENGGYFKARVIETEHTLAANRCDWSIFKVTFRIQPFFWLSDIEVTLSLPGTLSNPGMMAQPLIRVYGSGDITLTINGRATVLQGVSEYIDLDSELKIAYKGTVNQGDKLLSPFPYFDAGLNNISATGSTSIRVTPRWREL